MVRVWDIYPTLGWDYPTQWDNAPVFSNIEK